MRHLKHHAMHLLMCGPMLVVALIAIAAGASVASLLPVVLCMGMMAAMMGGMHGGHERDGEPDNRGAQT